MSEHANAPTREQVINCLRQLIAGELTPEAASDWARPWLTTIVGDSRVRKALDELAGADLPTSDREYLYCQEDFEQWLRDLTAQ